MRRTGRLITVIILIFNLAMPAMPRAAEDSGTWRGKWWNYYERALDRADKGDLNGARSDLENAVDLRGKDQRRARTYGMHFVDYFPHRELGVVLFATGNLEKAVVELETSIKSEESSKAVQYLNKARQAILKRQSAAQQSPPVIEITSHPPHTVTRNSRLCIAGTISGSGYVSKLSINGQPVRIELAQQKTPFSQIIPLDDGENRLNFVAEDLMGNKGQKTVTVVLKREGPAFALNEAALVEKEGKRFVRVSGEVRDSVGIREVSVGGEKQVLSDARHHSIDSLIAWDGKGDSLPIIAIDSVGNTTTATVPLQAVAGIIESMDQQRQVALEKAELEKAALERAEFEKTEAERTARELAERERVARVAAEQEARRLETEKANKVEEERIAKEKAESEKMKLELMAARQAEALRLAALKADEVRLAQQKAELEAKAAQKAAEEKAAQELARKQRLAHERTEQMRLDREKKEVDRLAREKAEAERIAAAKLKLEQQAQEKAEQERFAREREQQQRLAQEKAESEKRAREKAEQDRIARERDQQERIAKAKAEQERIAREKVELEKQAKEAAEQERLARLKAEEERIAAEKAEQLRLTRERDEQERLVRERLIWQQAEAERLAREKEAKERAEREKLAFEKTEQEKLAQQEHKRKTAAVKPKKPVKQPATKPEPPKGPDHESPVITLKDSEETQIVFGIDTFALQGHVVDNQKVSKVLVDGKDMLLPPGQKVYFNKTLKLKEGQNKFAVTAIDQAGNKVSRDITVVRTIPSVMQPTSRTSLLVLPPDPGGKESGNVTPMLDDYLGGAFVKQKRFKMIERKKLKQILDEQKFSAAMSDPDQAIKIGNMAAADMVIAGTVREDSKSVEVFLRVINSETSEQVAQVDGYTEDKGRESVQSLMETIASKVAENFPVVEGMVIKRDSEEVLADAGSQMRVKQNMGVIFFRKGKEIRHPTTGKVLGVETVQLGDGKISEVQDGFSKINLGSKAVQCDLSASDMFVTK